MQIEKQSKEQLKQQRLERKQAKLKAKQEKYYMASQWQLIGRKLRKHHLAVVSFIILGIMYASALFAGFLAPYGLEEYSSIYGDAPPTKVHFMHEGEFVGPFVYGYDITYDDYEMKHFTEDTSVPHKLDFFVEGEPYKLFGLIPTDIHFVGVDQSQAPEGEEIRFLLFGGDQLGRDIFSRVLIGSQVSLTVPLIGTAISFVLAIIIGGISGYYGGIIDTVIQRIIEVIQSFPTLPLWMALSAAIPADISVVQVYASITIIMSLLSWPGLARTVRSKFLSLKKEDYVAAAKLAGTSDFKIIIKHLTPGFMSYLIVSLTRGIPSMILGETSMSFLGLGMRPPATSWGVLLQEAQSVQSIDATPWKLIPVVFVIITVLAYNFLGDGLRDAADPYK